MGGDYAAHREPRISRERFTHFILPRLQRMVDAIHVLEAAKEFSAQNDQERLAAP